MKKEIQLGIIVVAFIAVIVAALLFSNKNVSYNGAVIDPAQPAFQFSLDLPNNNQFDLSETMGKVVLIFFGYTNCPDFCPTTLNDFKIVKNQLEDNSSEVVFLLVTIDPERDTSEFIWDYAQAFDKSFVGLSGSDDELSSIWENYWVFRAKDLSSDDENYLMSHSTRVIVIDTLGNFRMTFPYGMEPQAMTADILNLLAESN